MLRVSIHAGSLATVSRFNRLDWLDIGYARLAPIADYKVLLFSIGEGSRAPRPLKNYPRWSASLFELTARAIALCLSPDDALSEAVPAFEPGGKRTAFASAMSAVIEHCATDDESKHVRLATVDIEQHGRTRGAYVARFTEDAMEPHTTAPFYFAPKRLRPAELLLHAALIRLTGQSQVMPPRPGLCVPPVWPEEGRSYVPIHRLVEPARTGFLRWLHRHSEPPEARTGAPLGIAPELAYATFLEKAI